MNEPLWAGEERRGEERRGEERRGEERKGKERKGQRWGNEMRKTKKRSEADV